MKPSSSRATASSSHSVHGQRAEEEEQERERQPLAARQRDRLELAVRAVQRGDLAAVAHGHAVALELANEVVGHRLAQVGAAVEQRHERAAAREPDRGLARRVPAADDGDARGAAELRLGRAGRVEHAEPLVLGQPLDGQAPVLRAGREQHRARGDLVTLLEPDEVASVARLERHRAVRRRRARVELARLGDRPARQLRAGDPRREPEVVLDPPRRARLAAERGALDDERLEALGRAVDGGAEPGRTAADDDRSTSSRGASSRPIPSARETCPVDGPRSSPRRAAGRAAARRSSRAAPSSSARCTEPVAAAKSSIRIVASDECGPTISRPTPSTAAAPRAAR